MTSRIRFSSLVAAVILCCATVLCSAQSDRGSLTGAVSDSTGGMLPGAAVTATNVAMGTQYPTVTTSSGDYVIPQLPAGIYSLTVTAPGFSTLIRTGITISVSETARIDLRLAVGSTAATVQVSGDAPLLQTESPQNNIIVTAQDFNELPINITGVGAIRDPLMFAELAPGTEANTNGNSWNDIHINGAPGWTYRILIDGMENTSPIAARISDESQPAVESLGEFSLQQDSYSAEYGRAIGGIFNYTTKSGGNKIHGSLFNYLVNDALNAGQPFNYTASGNKVVPPQKQLDFGGSFGGPVVIPHLYNGHDRTFFFFSYEQYHNTQQFDYGLETVPTTAYRNGDLSYQLLGPILDGTGAPVLDCLGRPMLNGQIYNPATTRLANCTNGSTAVVRDPFPNNNIGAPSTWDPVAQKVLALIPQPINDQPNNNYPEIIPNNKYQYIPSIKIDQTVSQKLHISGYYANQETNKDNWGGGLPAPIDTLRWMTIHGVLVYGNADYALSPHLDVHGGAGYTRHHSPQSTAYQDVNQSTLLGLQSQSNLPGFHGNTFPYIAGLSVNGATMQQIGGDLEYLIDNNFQYLGSVNWIHGDHNFKFGGDLRFEAFSDQGFNTTGSYNFAADQTSLPSAYGQDLNGASLGNGFASFVLGQLNNASIGNAPFPWWQRRNKSIFATDTWKVTHKFTLNYGLRWDFEPLDHEQRYRETAFSPTVLNPNAGGLPGGIIYAGNGPGRCNCKFEKFYPWMIQPRLGVMYQLDSKTVVHAGAGLYSGQQSWGGMISPSYQGFGWNTVYKTAPSFGLPAGQLANGFSAADLANVTATDFDPGAFTQAGTIQTPPSLVAQSNGHPPRMFQLDMGFQHELPGDSVVEARWVHTRGVWLNGDGLVDTQQLDPARLASFGLNLTNPADYQLLTEPISSPDVAARGFTAPYAGFPSGASLAQALRPFPQFSGITSMYANNGNWWYDAAQVKFSKRLSHGLSVLANYTWSKDLGTVDAGTAIPIQDASQPPKSHKTYLSIDTPQMVTAAFRYTLPTFAFADTRWKRALFGGWTTDGIFKYQSGALIQTPISTNSLQSVTFAPSVWSNRVPNVPLFLHSLNDHSVNPYSTFFLNPAAWSNPAPGTYATSKPFYGDYRGPRYPSEQMGVGKNFDIREGMTFSVRADFFNLFNRWAYPGLNNAGAGNPYVTPQTSGGVITNGFGYLGGSIANAGGYYAPRSGEIVARIQF